MFVLNIKTLHKSKSYNMSFVQHFHMFYSFTFGSFLCDVQVAGFKTIKVSNDKLLHKDSLTVLIDVTLQVESLKTQGNECVRSKNFAEAVIHYTHAAQKDPKNHMLYSNRSLAFLKLQQFYYALEDAKETIKLQPYWAKVLRLVAWDLIMVKSDVIEPTRLWVKLLPEAEGWGNCFLGFLPSPRKNNLTYPQVAMVLLLINNLL